MRTSIRATLFGVAVLGLSACEKGERREDHACTACGEEPAASTEIVASAAAKPLEPWDAIDPMFNGCAGGCGLRAEGPSEGVVMQPGATIGQSTYCLVSGVVFEITELSVKREVDGKTYYFCCEGCASYFSQNQAQVSLVRGIT